MQLLRHPLCVEACEKQEEQRVWCALLLMAAEPGPVHHQQRPAAGGGGGGQVGGGACSLPAPLQANMPQPRLAVFWLS